MELFLFQEQRRRQEAPIFFFLRSFVDKAGYLSSCVSILLWQCLVQASAAAVDKLAVRGDGETTVTTAEAGVSAVIAQASAASYRGTVMEVKTTGTSDGNFMLFKVVSCYI